MNCPDCDVTLAVNRTIQWQGEVWRARKCCGCDGVFPSVERLAGSWPAGIHAKGHRAPVEKVRDAFNSNAGADLAGVMNLFARPVAPAQQSDGD